jgi:ribulose-5-phosphate 4-epimerase/fuculose-1-phosphate aldolase
MKPSQAAERIAQFGKSIFDRGLTAGTSGNISVKLDDGWLMTPTNSSLGELDPATLSRLDVAGKLLSGREPTKEAFLHRAMYEMRNDCAAVVHLHSTHSVAVSCLAEMTSIMCCRRSLHITRCESERCLSSRISSRAI